MRGTKMNYKSMGTKRGLMQVRMGTKRTLMEVIRKRLTIRRLCNKGTDRKYLSKRKV